MDTAHDILYWTHSNHEHGARYKSEYIALDAVKPGILDNCYITEEQIALDTSVLLGTDDARDHLIVLIGRAG